MIKVKADNRYPLSRPGKWNVFGLVAIGIFMSTLDGSIVNIALPIIMKELGIAIHVAQWVMMIYLLTVSSLLLSFGRLSDIRGRRWVYTWGLVVFSTGSLFCGLAQNALWLISARSFQGVGAAMIMACTPALIMDTFPASERGRALGMVGAVVASGLTLGPCLGGWITHRFSWPVIFFINIPIGMVTAWIVWRMLKGGPADIVRKESFDMPGAVFLALGLSTFLMAITHGHAWGYTSARFMGLLMFSITIMVGLMIYEQRIAFPVLDPKLLKIRLFVFPLCSAAILFTALFTMTFLMPFYLIHACDYPVNIAGLIMITPFAFLFVFSPISGAVSDRIGSRALCTVGMAVLALALFLISQLPPNQEKMPIIIRLALAGIGTAIFISPNSSITMGSVPVNRKGVAAGTVATARNLGMSLGIALAGTIFNATFARLSGGQNLKVYTSALEPVFMTAFHHAMMAGFWVAVLGIVVAYLRGPDRAGNFRK